MRPHGRAAVDSENPSAHAICDRCGFEYLHKQLRWQFQWVGFKMQNLRILVCESCYDTPQEQLRTILIPPDPVPIMNPRLPSYTYDNNPISTIAISPIINTGDTIGSLSNLNAAFDSAVNKTAQFCAFLNTSILGEGNTVGKNWGTSEQPVPADTSTMIVGVTEFSVYAPSDLPFLASGAATPYKFQGSMNGTAWVDLYSGTTAGTVGEVITITPTGGSYQYHRINFEGDGVNGIYVAQLQLSGSITGNQ